MKGSAVEIMQLMVIMSSLVVATSTVHLSITNSLGDGRKMSLHCRSKDDDLGMVEISDGNEFKREFKLNFWRTTLFYCRIWQGNVQGFPFDAYTYLRDSDRCRYVCKYYVLDDGIYTKDDNGRGKEILFYKWLKRVKDKIINKA